MSGFAGAPHTTDYTLSNNLAHAGAHLDQPLTTWPNQTIHHVLATYTAHRAVRLQPAGEAPGLQVMVAPRIEHAFATRQGLLLHLQALLADAPADWDGQAAEQLLHATEERLATTYPPSPPGASGKAPAAAYPNLAAALGSQILANLPVAMLTSLEEAASLRTARTFSSPSSGSTSFGSSP